MGGYGAYVWLSFAIAVVVLAALFACSLSFLRAGETALKGLKAEDEASDEA
jgi:heme exporter protein CcmD